MAFLLDYRLEANKIIIAAIESDMNSGSLSEDEHAKMKIEIATKIAETASFSELLNGYERTYYEDEDGLETNSLVEDGM